MSAPGSGSASERVAVVAQLKKGSAEGARELIEVGPPFDPQTMGFDRHSVYLSQNDVVFVFEGENAARKLASVVDNMVVSASFSSWAPLLEGTPQLAHELYHWSR